jgi:selenocysteine lyase/cysteine desulfurase
MNLGAMLAVPAALQVHRQIGPALKEARLRYLRDLWAERLRSHPGIEVLTPSDRRLYAGITSFRLRGQTGDEENMALARRLWEEHRIFTVQRDGVASGACVRVTPAVFTRPQEVAALATALERMA